MLQYKASWLLLVLSFFLTNRASTALAPVEIAGPHISNLEILTPTLAVYDVFQSQFDISTTATTYNLPYDPVPPPGMPGVNGITVDALFTAPGGETFIQPVFWYQAFTFSDLPGGVHYKPNGLPRWTVRFTPRQAGIWGIRIRAQDSNGISYFPPNEPLLFTVSGMTLHPYRQHGFIRVSPNDTRYFAFEDGTYFSGAGFNRNLPNLSYARSYFPQYNLNKINFLRTWMSMSSINGSHWSPWGSHHLSYNGYLPGILIDQSTTYNRSDVSLKLDQSNPCIFDGWTQGPIAVQPSTQYSIKARVRLEDVSGPAASGPYGFVIKTGEWLDQGCSQAGTGQPLISRKIGTSDWVEINATFTTKPSQFQLGNLYLALENTISGQVFIHEIHLYRSDDLHQVELLREPLANSHFYFDPINAAQWDEILKLASENGIYLKIVVDEKNEIIRNLILPDGTTGSKSDNNHFYAAEGTKVRWLAKAWWRWLIARWGYSTAIHSFEWINEGDPYNGNHYDAANSMGLYFKQNDPSRHMVTTSFWHSFPNLEFWSNSAYPNLDYADLHAYISTGWRTDATFLNTFAPENRPEHIFSGNGSAYIPYKTSGSDPITPRGIVLNQPGEWLIRFWMKAQNYAALCAAGSSGGKQHIRWTLDGKRSNIVPPDRQGRIDGCSSPGGTYDWRQFSSDRDRDGNPVAQEFRLMITDQQLHELELKLEAFDAVSGSSWIDQVEIVSPDGRIVATIGNFDLTPFQDDPAWYHAAYAELFSAASPVGINKPLIRGEGGVDFPTRQEFHPDLLRDTEGIWLHKLLWAQLSPGGMIDLVWWADQLIDDNQTKGKPNLYPVFKRYQTFLDGLQLASGRYRDWKVSTGDEAMTAWGQLDINYGLGYLWIYNRHHTWKAVVNRQAIPAISSQIILPDLLQGYYEIEWWDPYRAFDPIIRRQVFYSSGSVRLDLPYPVQTDIAIKIRRIPPPDWST